MIPITMNSFLISLTIWVLFMGSPVLGQTPFSPKPFIVFDGTFYSNKPDLSVYGMQPVTLVNEDKLGRDWYKTSDRLPSIDGVTAAAQEARHKGSTIVLDIEHWLLKGSADMVRDSMRKYITVLEWFRDAAPGLTIGYYGAPPIRDYWRAVKGPANPEYRSWMNENDQLRLLSEAVDALFPSLYTFYSDQVGWKEYAIAQIEEARRYGGGKPVYVFLWPQYHDSNQTLGKRYLPPEYWRLELETARQHADGIVIWGGWGENNRPAEWDESASWWQVTKKFLNRQKLSNITVPEAPTELRVQ